MDPDAARASVHVLAYGPDAVSEHDAMDAAEAGAMVGRHAVTWIDVTGLNDADVLEKLESRFQLHRLALEDVINVHQRPKVEEYDAQTYVVARMPVPGVRSETEQLSIFFGADYVLSFQERPGDHLDPVRERIRGQGPRLMKNGPDYLVYAILDAVLDAYFPIVEEIRDEMEGMEIEVFDRPSHSLPRRLHALKRELYELRRIGWSFREVFSALTRTESSRTQSTTQVYLRDCYDHTIQLVETIDGLRETASSLMEFHLSSLSNRMNEVMKVLTIIATIFIPLSFITGLYGMNFDRGISKWNMPELGWRYGYPAALLVMAAVALVMLVYFWRKGWLGEGDRSDRRPDDAPKS